MLVKELTSSNPRSKVISSGSNWWWSLLFSTLSSTSCSNQMQFIKVCAKQ